LMGGAFVWGTAAPDRVSFTMLAAFTGFTT
jgi:hypothetical protein